MHPGDALTPPEYQSNDHQGEEKLGGKQTHHTVGQSDEMLDQNLAP